MGILIGTPKYILGVLLSGVGFVSMYLFGGGLITLFKTFDKLFSGQFIEAFLEYYIFSALPPTSIGHIITNAVVGAIVAGLFWFLAMAKRGVAF
ncbi:MAG: hypothetical protein IH934_04950 [Nanoarchaeota archaeon]|nr:hypothetical protein [Nanoarchaeota archaeon]